MKINNILSIILLILCAFLAQGCSSTIDMQRIPINFTALDYNSALNKYTPRLTTVEFNSLSDSKTLRFHMDDYSPMGKYFSIMEVDFNVAINAVNKYLDWYEIANKDGDIVDKEISSGKYARMKFFSGNKQSHFFVIGMKMDSILSPDIMNPFYFDKVNAEKFRDFLISYQKGEVKITDSSKYN